MGYSGNFKGFASPPIRGLEISEALRIYFYTDFNLEVNPDELPGRLSSFKSASESDPKKIYEI